MSSLSIIYGSLALFFIPNGFCVPTPQPTVPEYSVSRQVLSEVYIATDGANWLKKLNWLNGNPCTNEWYGVKCSYFSDSESTLSYTDVTSLELMANSLRHSLPSSIGLLSGIRLKFRLDENSLTGTIPSQLGMLTKISNIFYIWENSFSGSLPSELGQLSLIGRNFKVSSNQFTGSLPSQLGQMTGLEIEFRGVENSFSGSLPSELGRLTILSGYFDLSSNLFCSNLPKEVSNLEALMTIGWGIQDGNSFGTPCAYELLTNGPTQLPTTLPTIPPTTLLYMLDQNRPNVSSISIFMILFIILISLIFIFLSYRIYDGYNWKRINWKPDAKRRLTNVRSGRESIDFETLLEIPDQIDRESTLSFLLNLFFSLFYCIFRNIDRCFGYILLNIVHILWRCGLLDSSYMKFVDPHHHVGHHDLDDLDEEDEGGFRFSRDSEDEFNDDPFRRRKSRDSESSDNVLDRLMKQTEGQSLVDEPSNLFGDDLVTINEGEEEEDDDDDEDEDNNAQEDGEEARSGRASRNSRASRYSIGPDGLPIKSRRTRRESLELFIEAGQAVPKQNIKKFKRASLGGFVKRLAYGEKVIPKARKKTVVAMEMGVVDVPNHQHDDQDEFHQDRGDDEHLLGNRQRKKSIMNLQQNDEDDVLSYQPSLSPNGAAALKSNTRYNFSS